MYSNINKLRILVKDTFMQRARERVPFSLIVFCFFFIETRKYFWGSPSRIDQYYPKNITRNFGAIGRLVMIRTLKGPDYTFRLD